MTNKILLLISVLLSLSAFADTPPPGTVKAKMFTGDGVTGLTATGTALNVNVTNSSGLSTVDQGTAGLDSWLVRVTSSALPTNACVETGGHLASIDSKLTSPLAVTGSFYQATQPISAVSLPLPSGAATESTLSTINSKTPALGQALSAGSVPVVLTASQLSTLTPLSSVTVSGTVTANAGSGTFTVDGSGHTQPVSGTFWQATQPVSASSLPLPSGASTESTLSTLSGKIPSNLTVTSTRLLVDGSGVTQPVSAASLPLPLGAATSAKQPALGIAGTASSDVLTVQGITSMTPLLVDGSGATQPVSGTVTANAGTGTFTVDASGHTVPVSGTFWQATQPVSGTVTANAGSGTFTVDASGFTVPVSGTFWQATQPVSGPLTDTQLRATPVPVSGTVTANAGSGTMAVSVASLPLPLGAATSAKQPALGTAGTASSDVITVQGITSMTALKVDGSGVTQPVSGTFWQATQPVSGTFWQATQPVSIATAPVLVAGSAIIGKVGIDQTTPGTTNGVQVNAALPAGSNVIGHVIVDTAPSTAVTNAGTFAVQATLAAETTKVIGTVNQGTSPWVENISQINGVTPLMGNGTTGTGSQRVTIASDNTAFTVNAQTKTPTATTVKQAAVTIGTSAVRLTTDGSAPSSTRVLLVAQLLSTSTANCFMGSSSVTSSGATRGIQMFAGQSFSFNFDAGDYYAICDATTQTFYITEQE